MSARRLFMLLLLLPALPGPARAQLVFYDADNSRIYLDKNFYTETGDINSSNYATATDVYATNGWLYNTSQFNGLYNQTSGAYFYSDNGRWNIAGSGSARLTLRSNHEYYAHSVYGSVYGDGTNFGLQNSNWNWMFYSAGGSNLVYVPGSMQIGTYGGLADNGGASIYGGLSLTGALNGYYGIVFGPNSTSPNLMWDGAGNGGWYYFSRSSYWRDYWTHSTRTWDINGYLQANPPQDQGYTALVKVVYRLYCTGGNGTCWPPLCPGGYTETAQGQSTLSSGFTGWRDCCWGTD